MKSPIIFIGMHRSGTSLVAQLLNRLGLFIGWERDRNEEAIFFVIRNEAIMQAQAARWDFPDTVKPILENSFVRSKLTGTLQRELNSVRFVSYLGPWNFIRFRTPRNLDFPWGWKDPRNTFLLPVWLDLFPKAKIVHVMRNGVDVALSLAAREKRRLDHVSSTDGSLSSVIRAQSDVPEGVSSVAWAVAQIHLRWLKGGLGRKYGKLRRHPCIDPREGFVLWEKYVQRARELLAFGGIKAFEIRFEDLLSQPRRHIPALADFCELDWRKGQIDGVISGFDISARYRFLNDPQGLSLFDRVRESEWMKSLGYTPEAVSQL